MQPYDTSRAGKRFRCLYQPGRNSHAAFGGMHARVENKGVDTAVPCDVYEADTLASVVSADVREAALEDL